jgi:hypothetical protein
MIKIKKARKQKKKSSLLKSYAFKNRDFLSLLSKNKKKKQRNQLIDIANGSQIKSVTECVMNLLSGNIPLSKHQLSQLKKHRKQMRELTKRQLSIKRKKQILKQKGGFLGAILPLAVSAIGSLLPGLFSSK